MRCSGHRWVGKAAALAVIAATCAFGVGAQSYPQWGKLQPGPYAVGFRHVQKYDHARHVKPVVNFAGVAQGETAYPVQIGIWYPAAKPAQGQPLSYEEFRVIALKFESLAPAAAADRETVRTEVRNFSRIREFNFTITDEVLKQVLEARTAAILDARPASGRFPVVLAGGYTLNAASVLCEYLASHGYVVMFAPTRSEVSTWQGNRPQLALNDRVRAYEYLTAEANALHFANPQKLAVLGVNYDGMPALLYQMENMRAGAVVSINGWETIRPNNGQILNSLYLNRLKMRVPYLNFHWDQPGAQSPADLSLVDSMKYAERFHFVVEGLDHAGLIGNPLALPYSGEKRRAGHEYMARTVQKFLDRYHKGDAAAEGFLRNSPAANGSPEVVLKAEWRQAALAPAPYDTEFAQILWEQKDVARATQIFRDARAANPAVQLFAESELDVYAFRYRQMNRPADELAIRQLVAEAYPRSFGALVNLGMAQSAAGRVDEGIKSYDRAMEMGMEPNAPNRGASYYNLGCGYSLAGQKDKAFVALQKAIEAGFRNRNTFETDDDLKALRDDPRFQQLLESLGRN